MGAIPMAAPGVTRIGWIGTGLMGSPMCAHLLRRGFSVTVSSRTKARAAPLVGAGATWAATAAEVAAASDITFTMVGFPPEVREVVLGPAGALRGAEPGAVLVDMSTSEPALASEIAAAAAARGVHVLDAPVSGGDVGARNAALSIMVGGPGEVFEAVRPCFDALGTTVVRQGDHGAGQHAKLVNQVLIAGNMVAVCEALLYAYRAGLDLDTVLTSVSSGAAGSWTLSNIAPRMISGDMEPGFLVDHFVKDMGIALAEAGRMQLSLPGLSLAHQLFQAVQAEGRGQQGTQALIHALATLNGIDWNERH